MSVTVRYNGLTKKLKVSSAATVQQVLDEATQLFGLDSARNFELQHNRKNIDKSQPFRFSGVSNNAVLELVEGRGRVSGGADARIALTAEGVGHMSSTFSSTDSLGGIIQHFVDNAKLPADIWDRSPSMVYIRQEFSGLELQSVSIQSLGLAGSSARLQLRFRDASIVSPPSDAQESAVFLEEKPSRLQPNELDPPASLVTTTSRSITQREGDGEDESVQTKAAFKGSRHASAGEVIHDSVVGRGPSGAIASPMTTGPEVSLLPDSDSPRQRGSCLNVEMFRLSLASLLKSNFDAASRPMVITATKYLDNLIRRPDELKYRAINTTNKIFRDTVEAARGGLEVITSLGFTPYRPRYLQESDHLSATSAGNMLYFSIQYIADPAKSESGDGSAAITRKNSDPGKNDIDSVLMSTLLAMRHCLREVMVELEIPLQDRPRTPVPPSLRPPISPVSAAPVVEFDPFKPLILRTSNQPRSGESTKTDTEMRLEQLERRKLQLQGERDGVERRTQIILGEVSKCDNAADGKESAGERSEDPEEDRRSQALALRAAMKSLATSTVSSSSNDEGPPLTTKALRDLEKIKREIVFSETLIKVRFPDKVTLQGYFHPMDSLVEVRSWIESCLYHPVPTTTNCYDYDLYITPPRTSLPIDQTLQALQLVPASIVYVSWRSNLCCAEADPVLAQRLVMSANSPGGWNYLNCELFNEAYSTMNPEDSKQDSSSSGSSHKRAFPMGRRLVGEVASASAEKEFADKAEELIGAALQADCSSKSESGGDKKKPKWLKV